MKRTPADDAQLIAGCIRQACNFSPHAHVPLMCVGKQIGWLKPAIAERLAAWDRIFIRDPSGVRIVESLDSADERTNAVREVVAALYQEGAITGWRDERYAVVDEFNAPPLLHVERAASRLLGITTYAAHANGFCSSESSSEMWLARRSQTKPIDPGLLDNLVGGGMCAGIPPLDTIVREAQEEAGIPAEMAAEAVPVGTVKILREVPEGVQSEVIFVHDLQLPADFQPQNMDGEVAEFRRLPMAELGSVMASGEMTLDSSLVSLSFMMRRGYIKYPPEAVADVIGLYVCGESRDS